MRIFLDANVLFSAAKSTGAVQELLRRVISTGHRLVADDYVVTEARRNLLTKFPDGLTSLEHLLANVEVAGFQPNELAADIAPQLPDKDRPVLGAAIRLNCDALVTGDRTHFGALYGQTIEQVRVVSPRMLAEWLQL